jgi:hypothetical protein
VGCDEAYLIACGIIMTEEEGASLVAVVHELIEALAESVITCGRVSSMVVVTTD